MDSANLEHVNMTVTNPEKTAALLCELFGWHIRWQGEALAGGRTVHVGKDDAYLALYAPPDSVNDRLDPLTTRGGLNHIGLVVNDLDAAEKRILTAGFETVNHDDYTPGKRFYFLGDDDIEYEVVSYT